MRFTLTALIGLAAITSAMAMPSPDVEAAELLARGSVAGCAKDYDGLAECKAKCPIASGKGHCHVIALGPIHRCDCS
ncbi:hypothetical protein AMS68_001670 [Peltaster fructicola]|uniref:Invertebrate defensins family profile domain-containing protein n=1 Tax=Peltaster fructicola TaxID=286661 RepID=A0A6H0XN53_9PEZI|nr:hypothetical protein AMS68_001670 [Peltaster fructicola]